MAVAMNSGGQLTLKRAATSRPSGEWNDDDYDVLADGIVVGRIMNAAAAPVSSSCLWTYGFTSTAALRSTCNGDQNRRGSREQINGSK